MNANFNYNQLDRQIKYFNSYNKKNIIFKYSTTSEYLDAIKKEKIQWDVKYDDMMPYGDNEYDWWVGFYSSRPNKK